MEIVIKAHSKELANHIVFIGNLGDECISESYQPNYLDGKLRCTTIKSDSIHSSHYDEIYRDRDGNFDPLFIMSVAVGLRLNGNYKVRHVIRRSEIITMLASVVKKSELADVVRQLEHSVSD